MSPTFRSLSGTLLGEGFIINNNYRRDGAPRNVITRNESGASRAMLKTRKTDAFPAKIYTTSPEIGSETSIVPVKSNLDVLMRNLALKA